MNKHTEIEIQAAAFRGLVNHLQKRSDVQNINLMNLAGFCRNCLSKWVKTASDQQNGELSYDDALQMVYGMSYQKWKDQYQTAATEEQVSAFKAGKDSHADTDKI